MNRNATVIPLRALLLQSAQRDALPSWCDLVVEEQDRWLVLGDSPRETDPEAWMRELSGTSVEDLLEAAAASEPGPPKDSEIERRSHQYVLRGPANPATRGSESLHSPCSVSACCTMSRSNADQ